MLFTEKFSAPSIAVFAFRIDTVVSEMWGGGGSQNDPPAAGGLDGESLSSREAKRLTPKLK